jgi:uncharacterized protein (TIGR02147 family)
MKSIFEYADYHLFLKNFFENRTSNGFSLTYEELGRKVGFTSKGFVTQIIQGKSKIPLSKIMKFGGALGLNKKELEYFELLVQFEHAKSRDQKNIIFNRLSTRFKTRMTHMGADKFDFYSAWYYSAIRSLLSYYHFKDDYKGLARQLNPAITPGQAKKAIGLMERLSMIRKDENGYYQVTDRMITTGDSADAIAIVNYQRATMDLAKEALDRFKKQERSASTLTLGLSEKGYASLVEKIGRLRAELMALAQYDTHVDRVIQVNLHAFPLTKSPKERS